MVPTASRVAIAIAGRSGLPLGYGAATRPTGVLVYCGAVSAASPPGGRKREGPSPAWAETAPAGSGRRRRLGPGPARDAPSPDPATTAWPVQAPHSGWTTGPAMQVRYSATGRGQDRSPRRQGAGGLRDLPLKAATNPRDAAVSTAPPAPCGQRMVASAASRVRARREPGALPALDPASADSTLSQAT